jgi:murein DD-endopeptidase MepM/ murein hydrolase activator NlpD
VNGAAAGLRRRFVCVTLVLVSALCRPADTRPSTLDSVQTHRLRLEGVRLRLALKQRELRDAARRSEDLHADLLGTNEAIVIADRDEKDLDGKVLSMRREVSWNDLLLTRAQASLARHTAAYGRRIVQMYEHGNLSYLEVLLQSRGFEDFVERWDELRLLIAADARAVTARRIAERTVTARRTILAGTMIDLEAALDRQTREGTRLAALRSERLNLIAVADQTHATMARQVAQLDELDVQEEAALENAIAAQQRALEAQRRSAESSGEATPARGTGEFIWPVRGPITSPFGPRPNPFGGPPDFHPGLDIAAPSGTPIVAADSGRVIIAGWVSGYGNYIAIDHASGLSSAYGHCSRIDVAVGQDVSRGQVIGAVGSTGHSTGPHVHFEIRLQGRPVDPAPRLP